MAGFLDDLPGVSRVRKAYRPPEKIPVLPPVAAEHDNLPTVYWHIIHCPACDSPRVPVHTTRRPVRYHKCLDCGQLFKSIEQ